MIIKISMLLMLIITIIVAAIFLPHFYWMAFDVNITTPRVCYSPVTNGFILSKIDFNGNIPSLSYYDTKGTTYTREKFEQLLPITNYRQLTSIGKMPDSLRGIKIDLQEVRINQFYMRIRPKYLDTPQIQLYPLFESQSGRIGLEMPKDFFRINEKMEFINTFTNKINEELTGLFTSELKSKGFDFPAKLIAGNPTTRKPFDEGYFILDAADNLFHIKMVKGKPFCVNTNIPQNLKIKKIVIREQNLKELYGLIISEDNNLFIITYDNYSLIKLPIANYKANLTNLSIRGNLFFRTFNLTTPSGLTTIVTDRDYKAVDKYKESWKSKYERSAGIISDYLFPFTIQLTDRKSSYVNFYIHCSNFSCLAGILFFLTLTLLMLWYRKKEIAKNWFNLLIVLISGIYGFIAILIFDKN